MEEQQRIEIGRRIRDLREASPHTNRSIADHVGVGERSVANWISGKTGITYEHAEKVARLFGVEIAWLWAGRDRGSTPDVLASLSGAAGERLDQIEHELAALRKDLAWLVAERKADAAVQAQAPAPEQSPQEQSGRGRKAAGS